MSVTFYECLMACASDAELVAGYNRLRGTSVGVDLRTPLERLIDSTSGYEQIVQEIKEDELAGFVHFAHDIWKRIPTEANP